MRTELFYNQWFGKAVGFTSAFILAPYNHTVLSASIVLGIAIGHGFDIWAGKQSRTVRHKLPKASRDSRTSARLDPHQRFLFAALGHLAKQGGAVLPAHVQKTQAFMRAVKLSAQQKKEAIATFNAGKSPNFDFRSLASNLATAANRSSSQYIVHAMCETIAIAPNDPALVATVRLASFLNIPPGSVAKEFGAALQNRKKAPKTSHRSQQQKRTPTAHMPNAENAALAAAYATLGIPANSAASEIKKAYRKLISKTHPDKLPQNASESRVLAATRQMIKLREALELIEAQQN
jgi:DnaJ like chaperone protein